MVARCLRGCEFEKEIGMFIWRKNEGSLRWTTFLFLDGISVSILVVILYYSFAIHFVFGRNLIMDLKNSLYYFCNCTWILNYHKISLAKKEKKIQRHVSYKISAWSITPLIFRKKKDMFLAFNMHSPKSSQDDWI